MVSVIIPVRNGAPYLERTLPALRRALPPDWEIIVVDDASTDPSRRVALLYADRVVASGGRGAPPARNRGAEIARGDILVFIDADILVTRKAVIDLVQGLDAPGVALTFGVYSEGRHLATLGGRFKSLWVRHSYLEARPPVRWMNTALAAIRKSDFRAVGGFDDQDDWLHGGNDIDFGRVVADRSGTIRLLHGVECDHLKELSLTALFRNDYNRTRGFLRTAIQSREIRRAPARGYGNISPAFMGGVLAAAAIPAALLLAVRWPAFLVTAFAAVAIHTALTAPFYRYAFPRLGRSAWCIPLIVLGDHLACAAGMLAEAVRLTFDRQRARKSDELSSGLPLPLDSPTDAGPVSRT